MWIIWSGKVQGKNLGVVMTTSSCPIELSADGGDEAD